MNITYTIKKVKKLQTTKISYKQQNNNKNLGHGIWTHDHWMGEMKLEMKLE